jgi:hypothetical protein
MKTKKALLLVYGHQVPAFLFFKDGELKHQYTGSMRGELISKVRHVLLTH